MNQREDIQKMTLQLPSDQDASGRMLGDEEISLLQETIESGTLTSTKGNFVKQLEHDFASKLGVRHAYACSSGTAAVHIAVSAVDPEPGDEIITTSITDMGALTPILYQGAIPVFADVEPHTMNVTAKTIEERLSNRTKAIIVTHLFGAPCEMNEIMALAKAHNLLVIEDCAQAFLARYQNDYVGAIGDIGCFSLQQGKHITTGEGGLVVCDDDQLARRMYLYINKGWGYGDPNPDHYFLALNYRLSELQGAVAVSQLNKLEQSVQQRVTMANRLTKLLEGIPGIKTPAHSNDSVHVYWRYCLMVDDRRVGGGATGLGAQLSEMGIACAPRYIQKPAFRCQIFANQKTFGDSRFPFSHARPEAVDYSTNRFSGTFDALEQVLVLPWNERYTEQHIDFLADAIRRSVVNLSEDKQ